MKEKAVRYLRVSTTMQDEESQVKSIDKFMSEKGWEVATEFGVNGTYRDHGVSAFKEVRRPDFENMLRDSKKREFQHIVVFDLERFSRKKAQHVLDLIKELRLMYGVEVNAVHGDEWRDLVNMINNIPNMGFIGKPLADFLESVIVGMKAYDSHLYSKKLSSAVKDSIKFKKAKKEQRLGRPKIPPILILATQELLKHYSSYNLIKDQLGYKPPNKHNERYPGEAWVSLVRSGIIDVIEINGKHQVIDKRKEDLKLKNL